MSRVFLNDLQVLRAALVELRRSTVRECVSLIDGAGVVSALDRGTQIVAAQQLLDSVDRAIDDENRLVTPVKKFRIGS